MYFTLSTSDRLLHFAGVYVDNITNELKKSTPNKSKLRHNFLDLLECLYVVLTGSPMYLNHCDKYCECHKFVSEHLSWIPVLEKDVWNALGVGELAIKEELCWFERMWTIYRHFND